MEVAESRLPVMTAAALFRFFHAGDDETLALRGVSLELMPGELVAVMGPSGSGKSTLLACLAGLDDPDGGVVRVLGKRLSRQPEADRAALRAKRIGVLRQSGNLIEHLSVIENIEIARTLAGGVGRSAAELLTAVGLPDKASAHPSRLSGGESARAGLAVALAGDPTVILADEPTGEVDADNEAMIIDLLLAEVARGTAVLVMTHSDRVAKAARRVLHLTDGVLTDV